MPTAIAPAKVILYGEHAVVYGEPALAAAVDLETRVTLRPAAGEGTTVNGFPLSLQHHVHIAHALELAKAPPYDVETASRIPSAAGLGSSAALSVATAAAALEGQGRFEVEAAARLAYEAERRAQANRGSPTDTATVALGGGVLVERDASPEAAWSETRGDRTWHLRPTDLPSVTLVVGNSLERGRTADQVARVARFAERHGTFAREIFAEIGSITRAGAKALARKDLAEAGKLMDQGHRLLTILGVSTPKLDRLCAAASRHAHGAKLTGSGGGGCIIALPTDATLCAEAVRKAGGEPYLVTLGSRGVRAFAAEVDVVG